MRDLFLDWYVKGRTKMIKAKEAMKEMHEDQSGASDMVSVVVLIVIVIAVAVIFRDAITQAAQNVMKSLSDFTK